MTSSEAQSPLIAKYAMSWAPGNPLKLLFAIGRFPVSPKAPLLLLSGFIAAGLGFGFLICLNVGGTWTQFFSSLALALFGAIIFHMGLFWLLR